MKKLITFLLISIFITSCMTNTTIPPIKNTIIMDYSKYVRSGFFITESNSVSFDYEPIGSVITTLLDGHKVTNNLLTGTAGTQKTNNFTVSDALNELVNECKNSGSNGVINLKITITGSTIIITGMAIRYNKSPLTNDIIEDPFPSNKSIITNHDSTNIEVKEKNKSKISVRNRR